MRNERGHGLRAGLSELSELLAVRVFKLESSEKRDDAVLEHNIVHAVKTKLRTAHFISFICAEQQNDDTGPAVARASTHLQEVFGFFQECANADAGRL